MDNRITVITGAAGGMGRACAQALYEYSSLLLCDVTETGLMGFADELRQSGADVREMICDVTDISHIRAVAEVVEKSGRLGALVHTAGVSPSMASGSRILEVNLKGTALLLGNILPYAKKDSVAVCISSIAGHKASLNATPEILSLLDQPLREDLIDRLRDLGITSDRHKSYSYSKLGVQRLVRNSACAWGERGARIVSVSPGVINTSMGRGELERNDYLRETISNTPLKRIGNSTEIADVVSFLCSRKASYVTGVDWLVDGGSAWSMMQKIEKKEGNYQ